jgi:aspartate aminotransferase
VNVRKHVSLNLDVRGLNHSATLAINDVSNELRSKGKTVYRAGLGQSPFPVPVPVVDALKLHAHEKDYLPARGLYALREAVADFHHKKDGVDARPEYVIIGPGSKELMFLLQLVYYGELLVPTPCWVSYIPQAKILGRQISLIHTNAKDHWKMTAKRLEEHCRGEEDDFRPRILVLNYPNNPVGNTYSEKELKKLAEVAHKYEVVLLSDEIYGQLHHQGKHVSVARFYPEGTIISSGLSKWCGAGGWRLGTFTFPPAMDWLLEKMVVVASETYTSVSAPIQYAAVSAFRGSVKIERYLWHARRILAKVGKKSAEMFNKAGIKVCQPEGGFYLFIDFASQSKILRKRGIKSGSDLCRRLLEDKGVAVLPGSVFGRPENELTARFAYVDFDGAKALTASETVPLERPLPDDFIDHWCGRVIEAARAIIEWVK